MSISIIIPTRNAASYMENLINKLLDQTLKPLEIIVIDTASEDQTKEICQRYKEVKFIQINAAEFDHGGTRNKAVHNATGDILVFMTQDAYPEDERFIKELTSKLGKDNIVASYGRQVARCNAGDLERFARDFNYSENEIVKSKKDIEQLGIKTFFMTNVCSAFIKSEFWSVGGFPEKTILNEDMIIASRLILSDKKVHYASNAKVIHSHQYTYIQQFKRNFDIGVSLKENEQILKYATSESEGVRFVREAFKYLLKSNKSYLIPHLMLDSGFRFIGYKMGMRYKNIPVKLVRKMSMHSFYFDKQL